MSPTRALLLSNVSAQAAGPAVNWQGGIAALILVGTMGGCTVSLQVLADDGATWVALGASTTVTATGVVTPVYVPAGQVRAVVTVATPTGLYCSLAPVLN